MKAIAFDFDGTLIDSMGMWRNLGRNFVESRGREYTQFIHDNITTMSLNQSSAFFKRELDLPESAEEIFREMGDILLDGYGKTLPLKEGAEEILEACSAYPVALATATNRDLLMPALRRFELEDYFDFIQTADEAKAQKSEGTFYEHLADRFGVKTRDIVLLDDAPYALEAAKDAGVYTIGVKDESNAPSWDQIKKIADETLESLKDFTPERYF